MRREKVKAFENFLASVKELSAINHSIESVRTIFRSKSLFSQANQDLKIINSDDIKTRYHDLFPTDDTNIDEFSDLIKDFFALKPPNKPFKDIQSPLKQCIVSQILKQNQKSSLYDPYSTDELLSQCQNLVETKVNEFFLSCKKEPNHSDLLVYLRHFYVRWCVFSSLLLREMTLKGCTSFGVFQVFRLLLDDYFLYNIKVSISKITNSTTIAAMRDINF
ncbi:MAG: Transcription factor rfx3 [Paramarteilia canceri]